VTLGPGQLSLFNLLKAYSLLDTQVGYCQGLSFVAGILLLHMEEDNAFEMMKHLLFHWGLRKQYKPDMSALQMQLYQLTRLLYEEARDIYEHFERHEIPATLYAAPWFLTLFASQFPIGFVARLFDAIFLMGVEALFRICLALLRLHRQSLLELESFESIMDFLKINLPALNHDAIKSVFDELFKMPSLKNKLMVYQVEYQVIREELLFNELMNSKSPIIIRRCSKGLIKS